MWRGGKFILAAILAGILVLGCTIGAVFARGIPGGKHGQEGQHTASLAEVEAILNSDEYDYNIELEDLENAFEQSRANLRTELSGHAHGHPPTWIWSGGS